MATNFKVKMGEIGRLIFIRRLGIPKRLRISPFFNDLDTLCINLVICVPVTTEF